MEYKKIQVVFFLGLLLATLALTLWFMSPYLYALICALTLAIVFQPLYNKLLKFFRGRRALTALVAMIVVLVILVLPFSLLAPELVNQTNQAYLIVKNPVALNAILEKLQLSWDQRTFLPEIDILNSTQAIAVWITGYFKQNIGDLALTTLTFIFNFFLVFFALYYIFKEGPRLKSILITYSPLSDKYDRQILNKLRVAVNSVVKGSLLVAFLQAVLAGIGFWIFGVPNPLFLSLLTLLAALVPSVGTAIIIVPASLYLLLMGNPMMALGLLLWGALLVGTIDNFVRPKLMEKDIKIHPLLIFLAVIGGLGFFGPMGFLLGPLVLSLLFALLDIYKEEFQDYIA